MILSQITTDPARFQFRVAPFSIETVNGILREGIIPAKFGTLPLLDAGDGNYIVAGDGHSRYEAVRQLAERGELPCEWSIDGGEWDIPAKIVTSEQLTSMKLANLARNNLTAVEEAGAFQRLLDDGLTIDAIATAAHKDPPYVKKLLTLNTLAVCIRERIGKATDAGGIDKTSALVLAEQFNRYGIGLDVQSSLWHKVLAHSDLTPNTVRGIMAGIGAALSKRSGGDAGGSFLFDIPASVGVAVKEMKETAKETARLLAALKTLHKLAKSKSLERLPAIAAMIDGQVEAAIAQLEYEVDSDGLVIGRMVVNS